MATKKIPIEIDLKTREAQRAVSDLNRELSNTEGDLEDVGSAGQAMARVITAQTDDIINELEETRRAVDALERALGPDFDADTTAVVSDLKKVGLTAQDIEADADELAAALRRAGDIKIKAQELGFTDVDQALGRTTDNSRVASTAIGGIGNSISELPGVGSLGPVAESMGMLAENALEGEANIKSLVVAGGGLAALGLAMGVISKAMSSIAETKAFHKERAEGFAEAVAEVGEGVDAVNLALEDTNRLTGRTGGMFGFFEGTKDVTAELVELGYTQEDVNRAIAEGGPALDDMIKRYQDLAAAAEAEAKANLSNESVKDAAIANMQRYNATAEVLKETREEYVKGVEEGTVAEAYLGEVVADTTDILKENAEATKANAEAVRDATAAQEAAIASTLGLGDSSLAYRNQVADTAATISEATLVQLDAAKTDEERAQAARDAEGAVYAQADAAVRLADDQATANGKTLTAYERAVIYKDELQRLADKLDGPARTAIDNHIASLDRIPRSIATDIAVRQVGGYRGSKGPGNARGTGYFGGGSTLVGEEGPEVVNLPAGSSIRPAAASADLAHGGGSDRPVVVNLYIDGEFVTRRIIAHERAQVAELMAGAR